MRIVFFVAMIFFMVLIILLFGLKFKVLLLFSSKNKSAFYTLNHRLFTIMQGKLLVLSDGTISVITKKNKMLQKEVPSDFTKKIALNILSKIKLTRLDVFLDTGKAGNAMTTALLSGTAKTLGGVIYSILKNKKVKTEFHYFDDVTDNEFSIAVDLNVKLNLFSLIVALLKARKEYKKEKEKEYATKNA